MLKPLSARPDDKDDTVLGHTLRSVGVYPRIVWIAVVESRDGIREFDGTTWTVIKDKRIPEPVACKPHKAKRATRTTH